MKEKILFGRAAESILSGTIASLKGNQAELEYRANDLAMSATKATLNANVDRIAYAIDVLTMLKDRVLAAEATIEAIPKKPYGVIFTTSHDNITEYRDQILDLFDDLDDDNIYAICIPDSIMVESYETKESYINQLKRMITELEGNGE